MTKSGVLFRPIDSSHHKKGLNEESETHVSLLTDSGTNFRQFSLCLSGLLGKTLSTRSLLGVRCLPATKSPLLSLIEPSIGTLANDKLFDCMANDKHYALSINNGIMRDVALGRVVVREPVCTR